MNGKLRASLTAAVLSIATGLLLPLPAASAKPHPKPNLVLTHAKLRGNDYAFAGETVELDVKDTVENEGRGQADNSVNELTIRHKGTSTLKDLTRKVPKLKPDEHDAGVGTARITIPADAKLGKYEAFVCADARGDVKEKNELDNCEELGDFYIAKRSWTGSFNGTHTDASSGITETFSATGATFAGAVYKGSGLFTYGLQATVTYTDTGTGNDCVYSGAGVDGAPIGYMQINYLAGNYFASVGPYPSLDYPIFCGNALFHGPTTATLLEIGTPSGQGQPLTFGTATLSGSQAGIVDPSDNFTWSLK